MKGRTKGDASPEIGLDETTTSPSLSARATTLQATARNAVDGDDGTYWLVPGGQRMEMMSRDKRLVLDLGTPQPARALSLLGEVDSLVPRGCWRPAPHRQVLGARRSASCPQVPHVAAHRTGRAYTAACFYRLYIRREGHATFRYTVRGVRFHGTRCSQGTMRHGLLGTRRMAVHRRITPSVAYTVVDPSPLPGALRSFSRTLRCTQQRHSSSITVDMKGGPPTKEGSLDL